MIIAAKEFEEEKPTTSLKRAPAPLRGKWLLIWRVFWSLIALFDLGVLAFSIPSFVAQQYTVCSDLTRVNCGYYQLTSLQTAALDRFGLSLNGYAVYALILDALITLAFLLVGALIFWHRSSDRMALFVSLLLITFGCFGISEVHLNSLNNFPFPLMVFGSLVLILQWPGLGLLFCLFPDGRLVPRWSWLLLFLFLIQLGLYIILPYPYDIDHWPPFFQFLEWLIVYGSTAGIQLYRYFAVATPLQHQQIKWLAFGFLVTTSLSVAFQAAPAVFPALNAPDSLYQLASPIGLFMGYISIPVSIGLALLRYRLWDIDVLINRTLVYGLLTVSLLGIYLLLVFGGQYLLTSFFSFFGLSNAVVLVISTLIVAALFQPLRRRVQQLVDRRFYRSKYDATRIMMDFNATLRQEINLEQLRTELLVVVQKTMQPGSLSLWLRPRKPQESQENQG